MNRHHTDSGPSELDHPPMMLVTELGTGGFLVQGYPTGPTAHIGPQEAVPLREALTAATGCQPEDSAYQHVDAPPIVRPRVGLPALEETRPLQAANPWA